VPRDAAQLAIGALELEHDPLGLRPPGVRTEVDPARGVERREAGLEEPFRFAAHVAEVGLHLVRPLDAAERPVARNDDLRPEPDDALERRVPAVVRAVPAD